MRSNVTLARRGGFTLVELLVVIGIIAVLIGSLLPSLSKARKQAQNGQCLSNLRQLGAAIVLYATEHKQVLPPVEMQSAEFVGQPRLWAHMIMKYVGKKGMSLDSENFVYGNFAREFTVGTCPSQDRDGMNYVMPTLLSFRWKLNDPAWVPGQPDQYNPSFRVIGGSPPREAGAPAKKHKRFKRTAEVLMLADGFQGLGGKITHYTAPPIPQRFGGIHSGRSNILLMDGHVEASEEGASLAEVYIVPSYTSAREWTIFDKQGKRDFTKPPLDKVPTNPADPAIRFE